MEKTIENNYRTCGCCHKELPIEAFYLNKRTQHADSYCKECRKSATNNRYRNRKYANSQYGYPVITQVTDPALRLSLILHAWQTVNESIARKRKKLREKEEKADRTFAG